MRPYSSIGMEVVTETISNASARRVSPSRVNWVTTLFLLLTPLVAVVWGIAHIHAVGVRPIEIAAFAFYVCATGFSITTGYHRLFAHRSYECSRIVKILYLLFGAAAFQHSALTWCSDHRRHHKHIDSDDDPYSIQRGFLWAHIGWLLVMEHKEKADFSNVHDLTADPWIRLQDRFYVPIAVLMGFAVPFAFGWAVGHPWGCVLWAGIFRVVLVHHSTFLVNSLAHTLGRRPYTLAVSARDSVVTALLTFGEGYHNFHHRFAADYRNGVARASWDPSKWLIGGLEHLGLAWNLRRVPRERIVAAELACDSERLFARVTERSEHARACLRARFAEMSARVEHAAARLGSVEREFAAARAQWGRRRRAQLQHLRAELRSSRLEMRAARLGWRAVLSGLGSGSAALPT
jgi:stearoyl-CoA desaturase (delta-9 desaturase)